MEYKINKESVDKLFPKKYKGYVEITDELELDLAKSLTDLIMEAHKQALKDDIRANTVMISKRLAKVNRITHFFGNSYADFPPLICGLEAYVTDELPDEFAFGLVEAPMTQREAVFEDGRKTGYDQGYKECAAEIFEKIEIEIKNHGIAYTRRKIAELKKKHIGKDNTAPTNDVESIYKHYTDTGAVYITSKPKESEDAE